VARRGLPSEGDGVARETASAQTAPNTNRPRRKARRRREARFQLAIHLYRVAPEACQRTLPIFDGRRRYDLKLAFKRIDTVKADKGYQGPVVVCTMLYRPIAGHRPERPAIKYLVEQRDMEMWLAPIAGTRVLVPFRFSIPTPFGLGVLQATYFVAQPQPTQAARQTPAAPKTQ